MQPSSSEYHRHHNFPPPLPERDLYASDAALGEAIGRECGRALEDRVSAYGALAGGELGALGEEANANPPVLASHDRYGERIDRVTYHPAYHRLMEIATAHAVHALPWRRRRRASHVARAGLVYLHYQAEAGTCCPLTMTFASVAALRRAPELARWWEPRITRSRYDPSDRPPAAKRALTIGMAMTEKSGGSDVRQNQSRAEPDGPDPQTFALTGHKWFCSAPMSDAFLTLARTDAGPTCFLMPRWRRDGTRNRIHIVRLKNKLGNHSNASSEIEFERAEAHLVGEPGRGIATIIEMVALTRFDCAVASAGLMRQALVQAIHHADHRRAFGRLLIGQPLMRNVLADLALESEAALALGMRLARAIDRGAEDPAEAALARVLQPLAKYWICRRAVGVVNEVQECLGGAGYVEDFVLARLYREAPLNSIWEGCGNLQCLDLLRALAQTPECAEALRGELQRAHGADRHLDAWLARTDSLVRGLAGDALQARRLAEHLALAFQAALLVRGAPAAVADAFCAARLGPDATLGYGTLAPGADREAIIERARPR